MRKSIITILAFLAVFGCQLHSIYYTQAKQPTKQPKIVKIKKVDKKTDSKKENTKDDKISDSSQTNKQKQMNYLNQLDPRWSSVQYGPYTFGPGGCLPTSMTMVINWYTGQNLLPTDVGNILYQAGYFNGTLDGEPVIGVYRYDEALDFLASTYHIPATKTADDAVVREALMNGKCVSGDIYQGGNSQLFHFETFYGYEKGEDGIEYTYGYNTATTVERIPLSQLWNTHCSYSRILDENRKYGYVTYLFNSGSWYIWG